jgi:hypothetical protein
MNIHPETILHVIVLFVAAAATFAALGPIV